MARGGFKKVGEPLEWTVVRPENAKRIYLQSHIYRQLMPLPLEKLQRISELHGCKVEAVYWEIDEHPRRERTVKIRFKEAT